MTKLRYLRPKRAKGRDYYYFDAGKDDSGATVLTPLPHIRDPRFGDCYARALAERRKGLNKQGVVTLDGLIRSFEKSPEFRERKESTKRSYSLYLATANRLVRTSSGQSVPIKNIEKPDIIALRDALADTPGAANQAVRAVSALFAWAIENGKAKDNPAAKIKKFKAEPHPEWPDDLLEAALDDPQVGMPVALLYFTGQRIADAVRMSWADIRGDHMIVRIKKKDDKIVRVAILPELAERLNALERKAVTILTNANGQPWTASGLRQKLQDWAKARGHKVVPHGLRKNAVNALFEAGCTAAEVSGITDQSIGMLEHYSKGVNKLTLGRAAVVKFDAARKARNKA